MRPQKTGDEPLTSNRKLLQYTLADFWRWSVSDLLSNATRGRFAEFIVATALGIDMSQVRDEWAAYDLITAEGIKVEVKSASYVQSWYQRQLSKISYSIKPSQYWDSKNNIQSNESKRQADVYVFCLLKNPDKATIDPLNLDQWQFYVVSTREFDHYSRSQVSITLRSLEKLTPPIGYSEIMDAVIRKSSLRDD